MMCGFHAHCAAAALLLGSLNIFTTAAGTATGEDSGGSCATVAVSAPTRGSVLIQVNEEVGKSTHERLLARAHKAHISGEAAAVSRRRDSSDIAALLLQGLEAIKSSLSFFQAEQPDVLGGMSKLGEGLLECIDTLIGDEERERWSDYEGFRERWLNIFRELPQSAADIRTDLENFAADGKMRHLTSALSKTLEQASDLVLNLQPGGLGTEIASFMDSLDVAFASVGEVLVAFEDGDTLTGVEAAYWGLRNATESILPADMRDGELYSSIVGSLDAAVSSISEDILDYKRRLMEGGSCWKVSTSRQRSRPSVCPEGYHWDGERHCLPVTAPKCWEPAPGCVGTFSYRRQSVSGCTTANHDRPWCSHGAVKRPWTKWSNCKEVPCGDSASLLAIANLDHATWKKTPTGAIPATCAEASEFPEKDGGWCYARCPDNSEAIRSKCWARCQGAFGADSRVPMMCGRNEGVLMSTKMEMVTVTLNAVFGLGTVMSRLRERGVDAEKLTRTVSILVDMGKPFALPSCPAP